jgi:hypothetical protein
MSEYQIGEFPEAFKGLEILAESGDMVSQYYVGLIQRTDSSRKLSSMVEFLKECFADLH